MTENKVIKTKTALQSALKTITPHCKNCGAELSKYWYYDENYQFIRCEKCGELNRRKR